MKPGNTGGMPAGCRGPSWREKFFYAFSGAAITAVVLLAVINIRQPEETVEFAERAAEPAEFLLRDEPVLRARRMEPAPMVSEKEVMRQAKDMLIKKWQLEDDEIKETREKLGDKWQVVEQRISEDYITRRLGHIKETMPVIEERAAGGYLSEETAEILREYSTRQLDFLKSNYFIFDRELIIVPGAHELSPPEEEEVELIKRALASGTWHVQDGARAVIESDEKHHIAVFEFILPEGLRGPDFAAKIIFDKKTGEIVHSVMAP